MKSKPFGVGLLNRKITATCVMQFTVPLMETVTTFAVVTGAAGANLSPQVAIILGFANLLADGFSMGVGNYLSTRAESEQLERARRIEEITYRNNS